VWQERIQPTLFQNFRVAGIDSRVAGEFRRGLYGEDAEDDKDDSDDDNDYGFYDNACEKREGGVWWGGYSGARPGVAGGVMPERGWFGDGRRGGGGGGGGGGFCGHEKSIPHAPFGSDGWSDSYRQGNMPGLPHKPPSQFSPHQTHMHQAANRLAQYNARWDYIDSLQQPLPSELPWPKLDRHLPFDEMKYDVFAFFARGCGLEPDEAKSPRLDFRLCPRSPYPSQQARQQECERTMLKAFKAQMQRDKLRWHEDKLGRKFPQVVGREGDEEARKAVWAAIAEGSVVCDKRLGSML
jgi:hypothetical protein